MWPNKQVGKVLPKGMDPRSCHSLQTIPATIHQSQKWHPLKWQIYDKNAFWCQWGLIVLKKLFRLFEKKLENIAWEWIILKDSPGSWLWDLHVLELWHFCVPAVWSWARHQILLSINSSQSGDNTYFTYDSINGNFLLPGTCHPGPGGSRASTPEASQFISVLRWWHGTKFALGTSGSGLDQSSENWFV